MEKLDVSSPRPRIWIGEKKWKNIKFAIAFPKVLYNEDIGIKIFQYLTMDNGHSICLAVRKSFNPCP